MIIPNISNSITVVGDSIAVIMIEGDHYLSHSKLRKAIIQFDVADDAYTINTEYWFYYLQQHICIYIYVYIYIYFYVYI